MSEEQLGSPQYPELQKLQLLDFSFEMSLLSFSNLFTVVDLDELDLELRCEMRIVKGGRQRSLLPSGESCESGTDIQDSEA
jgi:hypothetical protein